MKTRVKGKKFSYARLDLKNLEETKNLMDKAAYEKFLQEED